MLSIGDLLELQLKGMSESSSAKAEEEGEIRSYFMKCWRGDACVVLFRKVLTPTATCFFLLSRSID
jgi:hypothetical protein